MGLYELCGAVADMASQYKEITSSLLNASFSNRKSSLETDEARLRTYPAGLATTRHRPT